jgi:hypothetical protein
MTQLTTTEPSETGSDSGQVTVLERPAAVAAAGQPGPRPGLRGRVSARTAAIFSAAVLVAAGLILWGAGVFSSATPRVSLAVVGPASLSKQVAAQLDANKTAPLGAAVSHSEKAATRQVRNHAASAILVVDPPGTTDTLQVPSTMSNAQATHLENLVRSAEASLHRTVTITTVTTTNA